MKTIPNVAIYIDLDDTLAQFSKRATELIPDYPLFKNHFSYGIKSPEYEEMSNRLYSAIENDSHFWINLEPLEDMTILLDYIHDKFHIDQIGILTTPMYNDSKCLLQKQQWVKKHTKIKHFFHAKNKTTKMDHISGHAQILIDDRDLNVNRWCGYGGEGIVHNSASNTIRDLDRLLKMIEESLFWQGTGY